MPISRSRVALLLVAGLSALLFLGAADRVASGASSGGRDLRAQTVELGRTTLDQPTVAVDAEWSAAKRVTTYRDVIVAIGKALFVLAAVACGELIARATAVSPVRSWRAARRDRAPPARQLFAT